jgi:hypothetical protein
MTTETSNARGWGECVHEWVTTNGVGGVAHRSLRCSKCHRDRASIAPPPAAARGDVRAVLQEMRDRQVARRFKSQTLTDWADRIEAAISAEGVHCDSCNGSGVVVTYVDPYERGDVSSPEQSPCPDCAEGVQAGEVEQRARELLAAEYARNSDSMISLVYAERLRKNDRCEPWEPELRAIASALSQQPEARGVVLVTEAMVSRAAYCIPGAVPTLEKAREVARRALTAALTGERNG